MHKPNYLRTLGTAALVLIVTVTTFTATASADPTSENVTKLIVETLATWIPFVILFVRSGRAPEARWL